MIYIERKKNYDVNVHIIRQSDEIGSVKIMYGELRGKDVKTVPR